MDFHSSGRIQAGTLITGRYRVGALLGVGAMGAVHAGTDERLDRPVALKFLRHRGQATPHALERFEREARSAARLQHPNIVGVSDFLENDGRPFLVMEHLVGRTLQEALLEQPLKPKEAIEVQLQVLAALGAAHEAGILHRDIKPANIFLIRLETGGILVKLLDFGLARLLEEKKGKKLTATGITLGTPAYMAPERLMGAGVDPRSDLYSVGVCLHESVYGRLPSARSAASDSKHNDVGPQPETSLDLVIRRACAHSPDRRFRSAAEMAAALRARAVDEIRKPKTARDGSWFSVKTLRTAAAATAIVVQVAVSLVWLGYGDRGHDPPRSAAPNAPAADSNAPAAEANTPAEMNTPADSNPPTAVATGAALPSEPSSDRIGNSGDEVDHDAEPMAPRVANSLPASHLAASLPAESHPAESLPAESLPAESLPAESLPAARTATPIRTTRPTPMTGRPRHQAPENTEAEEPVLADRPIVPDWGSLQRARSNTTM